MFWRRSVVAKITDVFSTLVPVPPSAAYTHIHPISFYRWETSQRQGSYGYLVLNYSKSAADDADDADRDGDADDVDDAPGLLLTGSGHDGGVSWRAKLEM